MFNKKRVMSALQKYVYILLAILLTGYFFVIGDALLMVCVASVFIALLLLPVYNLFKKWGLHDILASLFSVLLSGFFIVSVVFFIGWQVVSLSQNLTDLESDATQKINEYTGWIDSQLPFSEEERKEWINENISTAIKSGSDVLVNVMTATGTFLFYLLLIPVLTFLILIYKSRIKKAILMLFKDSHDQAENLLSRMNSMSMRYLTGVMTVVAILAVINFIGFWAIGLEYALLFGVIAGLLNIIPYVGVLIGSALPVLYALLTMDHWGYAVGVLGICIFSQTLESNLITPKITGSSVQLNPLAAFLSLLIGGMIWGIVGMVLAILIAGVLKAIFDTIPGLKPIGYLMGDNDN